MIVVADTNVILDFLDGQIADPFALIRPYQVLLISPVVLHEVLRTFPEDLHPPLIRNLGQELLPAPSDEHWQESARLLRKLYPKRKNPNVARMQNDLLIALAARDAKAPVWSRDADFRLICDELQIVLLEA